MAEIGNRDGDVPLHSGALGRLQAWLGRRAIALAVRVRRPVSLGVRLLALNAQGEILLVRHTYLPGLMLPGGAVDPGETCREAAAREVFEEAGAVIESPPKLFHVYLNRRLANRDHVVLFVSRDARMDKAFKAGMEIVSAEFYSVDALPEDVTPATLARLSEVLDGVEVSDEW